MPGLQDWGWKKYTEFDPDETEEELTKYKNQIDDNINRFCEKYGLESLINASQNTFNGCLKYIYQHVFKPTKRKVPADTRCKSIIDYNNIDLLFGLLEHYIYLCDIYNKAVYKGSFCSMIGIDLTVLYDWYNGSTRADNPKYAQIFKILTAERERSISDKLLSNSKSPIGLLGVLNHENGWNLPGTSKEVHHIATVETPEQIAERYRSRIADKGGNSADNSPDGGSD